MTRDPRVAAAAFWIDFLRGCAMGIAAVCGAAAALALVFRAMP